MAGLDPATKRDRVCGRKRVLSRADARYWVAASRAAMTKLGELLIIFAPSRAILLLDP